MKSVLFSSVQAHSGKSAVCLGLGLNYRDKGRKVGYFKPLGIKFVGLSGALVDEDAEQAKATLKLEESLEDISPLVISPELYGRALSKREDLSANVLKAFSKVSKGKDVLIIDGIEDFTAGRVIELSDLRVAEMLKSKILLVSTYDSMYVLDPVLSTVDLIRGQEKKSKRKILAGIIFNQVRSGQREELKSTVIPFLEKQGIEVFGVLPRDRLLKSITVKDAAKDLNGEILAGGEKSDRLIESLLVGAMSPAHAMKYFRSRTSPAVVTGGDRSDIQLAALEANVSCIILTGNLTPTAPILSRADELKIPIILVKDDTLSTVGRMEKLLTTVQVKGEQKMQRIISLVEENVNLKSLEKALS